MSNFRSIIKLLEPNTCDLCLLIPGKLIEKFFQVVLQMHDDELIGFRHIATIG
jgi:hypothetical protein